MTKNSDDDKDKKKKPATYKVGYKKPPEHSRFQPGHTRGNRKGRPKGSKNISTMMEEEANALVFMTEEGRRKKLPKIRVGIKQLANKAASGDLKALIILLGELRWHQSRIDDRPEEKETDFSSLTIEEADRLYQEKLKQVKPDE